VSTRRTQPGGWVGRARRPCRRCGGEVPTGRWTFCSPECVHQWKLRTDPGYLREQVFARDRGVCARCGLDTEALRKDKRKLDFRARRAFEREWGVRRRLWDADHIVPVAEGGGECGLSNMRTLCLRCHREVTAELRARLAARRSKTPAGAAGADRPVEAPMPGKKAHVKRNVDLAAKAPAGKARKSAAQTEGQYTAAGDEPLAKK
jgi:5-methylcytosine-specific restriction enzyme A